MGYWQAGFNVIGFDIEPQPNYPFEFHQMDALSIDPEKLNRRVQLVHASPPCQFYSITSHVHGKDIYDDLIAPTRDLLSRTRLRLCGSSFGLRVRRHRLFEISIGGVPPPPCNHYWQDKLPCYSVTDGHTASGRRNTGVVPVYGNSQLPNGLFHRSVAMGIHWMTVKELDQAIPPVFTYYIGRKLQARCLT